jgi:hypothetical protein
MYVNEYDVFFAQARQWLCDEVNSPGVNPHYLQLDIGVPGDLDEHGVRLVVNKVKILNSSGFTHLLISNGGLISPVSVEKALAFQRAVVVSDLLRDMSSVELTTLRGACTANFEGHGIAFAPLYWQNGKCDLASLLKALRVTWTPEIENFVRFLYIDWREVPVFTPPKDPGNDTCLLCFGAFFTLWLKEEFSKELKGSTKDSAALLRSFTRGRNNSFKDAQTYNDNMQSVLWTKRNQIWVTAVRQNHGVFELLRRLLFCQKNTLLVKMLLATIYPDTVTYTCDGRLPSIDGHNIVPIGFVVADGRLVFGCSMVPEFWCHIEIAEIVKAMAEETGEPHPCAGRTGAQLVRRRNQSELVFTVDRDIGLRLGSLMDPAFWLTVQIEVLGLLLPQKKCEKDNRPPRY